MKTCLNCEVEIDGKDGENLCPDCEVIQMESERKDDRAKAARIRRRELREVYASLGLKGVRGSLGGVYWE